LLWQNVPDHRCHAIAAKTETGASSRHSVHLVS
jgi:hypothetical protein